MLMLYVCKHFRISPDVMSPEQTYSEMYVYLPLRVITLFILINTVTESKSIGHSYTNSIFAIGDVINATYVQGIFKHKISQFKKPCKEDFFEVEGVKHYRINDGTKASKIEEEYRRFLSMRDFKYVYKRDGNWRTWRELTEKDGRKTLLYYKFQNVENVTCDRKTSGKTCYRAGFWILEDTPPACPYEFFSQINDNTFCGANINDDEITRNTCVTKIKMWNVTGKCDNPLKTTWRVTRLFKKKTKRQEDDICKGRDLCQFSTVYTIRPTYAVFRIINATNNIILYSRAMRSGNQNYACVRNCGKIDVKTMEISQETTTATYEHSLDLFRETHTIIKEVGQKPVNIYDTEWIPRPFTRKPKKIVYVHCAGSSKNFRMVKLNSILDKTQRFEVVTMSHCKEMNLLRSEDIASNGYDESGPSNSGGD